jgi:hypothetical protein
VCETWYKYKDGDISEQGADENIWTKVKMVGTWRNLHNDELHNLYSSPNIIRTNI